MRISEISRIAAPHLHLFESYVQRGLPVILDGVADDWPARGWTIEGLEQACGANHIYYEQYLDARSRLGWWDFQHSSFSAYLERMRRGDPVYVTNATVGDYFPQLLNDLRRPPFLAADRKLQVEGFRMFIGRAQRTEIHYHPGIQVILLHLFGGKRKVVLYPPSETTKLYPFRWYEQVQMSRILSGREAEFPKLEDAHYCECELEAGQALFIPIHWWHWAQSFDETIAVGLVFPREYRDKSDLRLELRDRASETGERLLALSPAVAARWRRFVEWSAFR